MRTMTARFLPPILAFVAIAVAGVPAAVQQQPPAQAGGRQMVANSSLTWADANVPGFAPGMRTAIASLPTGTPAPRT